MPLAVADICSNSRGRNTAALLLFLLLGAAGIPAGAQNTTSDSVKYVKQAGSRLTDEAQEKDTVVQFENDLVLKLTVPAIELQNCSASIALDYQQRNTIARVKGLIENKDCPVANGNYELVIRLKDDAGESRNLEFSEHWQKSEGTKINFVHDYEIGSNVELQRVSIRRSSCTCETDPAD